MTGNAPPAPVDGPPGFHFLVPVWGEAYTRLFLDVVLPAHLSPGNLRAMSRPERCVYRIFTTPENFDVIRSAEAFGRLEKVMPVELHAIDLTGDARYGKMSECYQQGVHLADADDAAIFFLNADLLFADGSFAACERLVARGVRVVETTGIRLLKPAVSAQLLAHHWSASDGWVKVTSRELIGIALDNLHPIMRRPFWDGREARDLVPSNLIWPVAREGLLLRCYHLHPLVVWPEKKNVSFYGTVDDDYPHLACPDPAGVHVVEDSDELLFCELSDLSHDVGGGIRRQSIPALALWARAVTHPRHRALARHRIRLHATEVTPSLWEPVERASDAVLARVERYAPVDAAQAPGRIEALALSLLLALHVLPQRSRDWLALQRQNSAAATVWWRKPLLPRIVVSAVFTVGRKVARKLRGRGVRGA